MKAYSTKVEGIETEFTTIEEATKHFKMLCYRFEDKVVRLIDNTTHECISWNQD